MVPPATTRLILETARIEAVVQDFLTLRRSGSNLIAPCPFHLEKSHSFNVSPAWNIYHCFRCGKGGNSAKFLMDHEGFSFPDALCWLATKYRIEIPVLQPTLGPQTAQSEEESLLMVNVFAQQFFQSNLLGTGAEYFKKRGFSEETIHQFNLGYAPNDWDALSKAARKAGIDPAYLQKLGLTSQSGKDFFRNRVIFPIHNLSGRLIAFAGRILPSTKGGTDLPKYLNSPESDLYHKGNILYGIHFARKAIRQQDSCILVEGYTDLIALHQAGIDNVVATAGTAVTVEQLLLIRRFTKNITILFDGDPAGIKAALKGLDLALELDINVKLVPLPHPDDPDSFLKKVGITAFATFIRSQAKDFIQFKTNLLLQKANQDPVKKAALVHDIVGSIARIPDPLQRWSYLKNCALLVGLSEEILVQETTKAIQSLAKKQPPDSIIQNGLEPAPWSLQKGTAEHHLTRLLLERGSEIFDQPENTTVAGFILNSIEDLFEHFADPLCHRICEESRHLMANGLPVTLQHFIAHENLAVSNLAVGFAALLLGLYHPTHSPHWQEMDLHPTDQVNPNQTIEHAVLRFRLETIDRRSQENRLQIETAQRTGDLPLAMKFLQNQSGLDENRNKLAAQLGKWKAH